MNDFYKNEYLLIDKMDDFHYFKNIKSIAEYLNMTPPQVYAIVTWSRLNLNNRQYKTGLYIQRLFNIDNLQFPADTTFIWDWKTRKNYNSLKAQRTWYQEKHFGNN